MTEILLRGKLLRTVAPGGILQVQRQVSRVNEEVVKAPLKTKNSYRTISLGVNAVGILKEQRKKCGSSEYVFPSPTGGPISPDDEWRPIWRSPVLNAPDSRMSQNMVRKRPQK